MSGPRPSWPEHLAAAQAMGLSAAEALDTYEGWPAQVRAGRERREQVAAWIDQRETDQGDAPGPSEVIGTPTDDLGGYCIDHEPE